MSRFFLGLSVVILGFLVYGAMLYQSNPTLLMGRIGPDGFYPNPKLTPGSVNPSTTKEIICGDNNWSTKLVRDSQSTPTQKETMYAKYGIEKPKNNVGASQTCELDHFIPLLLGGSDRLDNIWPQCGSFRQKDVVELHLKKQVCDGKVSLPEAQKAIREDWVLLSTSYLLSSEPLGAIEDLSSYQKLGEVGYVE